MNSIPAKRGRPKGKLNTPKTINVPLSKLMEYFKDNTLIEVSTKYVSLLNLKETDFSLVENLDLNELADSENSLEPKQTIKFELRQPRPKTLENNE